MGLDGVSECGEKFGQSGEFVEGSSGGRDCEAAELAIVVLGRARLVQASRGVGFQLMVESRGLAGKLLLLGCGWVVVLVVDRPSLSRFVTVLKAQLHTLC